MRTPIVFSRITFNSPFTLRGVFGAQPAGTYSVETHDDYQWEFPFSWKKRTRSKIRICATPGLGGALQQIDVCPRELFRLMSDDQSVRPTRRPALPASNGLRLRASTLTA